MIKIGDILEGKKKCCKCFEVKNINDFHKQVSNKSGYRPHCKKCKLEDDKVYRLKNKDKIRKYQIDNKDKINKQRKVNLTNNINARISARLRSRLWNVLKYNYKNGSAINDLGCSIDYFKVYIESLFLDGMTWDNWTVHGWHIDHIKPLNSFNLTNRLEFLKAAHYTNMQPLWCEDNLIKGKK